MVCPMMSRPTKDGNGSVDIVYCYEKQCAWWAENFGVCAIKGIDDTLNNLDEQGMKLTGTFVECRDGGCE